MPPHSGYPQQHPTPGLECLITPESEHADSLGQAWPEPFGAQQEEGRSPQRRKRPRALRKIQPLKSDAETELALTRSILLATNCPKSSWITNVSIGISKLYTVRNIEHLKAKFHF